MNNEESLLNLPPIEATLKSGEEKLTYNGNNIGYKLINFWQWSVSDILSNATRGRFAEFIVGTAIEFDNAAVREEHFQSFVYLPLANFDYVSSFWQTSTAAIVKFSNYSYIDYKSHLLHKKGVQSGDK